MKTKLRISNKDDSHTQGNPRAKLIVEVVQGEQIKRFDRLLNKHHYLQKAKPAGDFLRQVAVREGQWVGLLAWGAACYSLKDRDQWIGWTHTQRAERLKLVAQNRRFLLLAGKGQEPNLASEVLGASVRVLAKQWQERFGYEPVLAETFTDIEQFHGTCYKAAGWQAIGMSKGYARHRADFYIRNDRPKKLWLKELRADARPLLRGGTLPEAQKQGGRCSAHGVMPLNGAQRQSLCQVLEKVPDIRKNNSQFSVAAVLSIIAMALLSGCYQISQMVRFGNRLTQAQRMRMGLPRRKTRATPEASSFARWATANKSARRETRFYRAPCYDVYYQLLRRIDPDQFAGILNDWLEQNRGTLPSALAIDGKMIRHVIGVVTLADHEDGVAHAMTLMSEKEGEGERCEMKSAQALLENIPALDGQIITADPLHAQKLTAQIIVEKGGDYLFQIKGNRPKLLKHAQKNFQDTPFFST